MNLGVGGDTDPMLKKKNLFIKTWSPGSVVVILV